MGGAGRGVRWGLSALVVVLVAGGLSPAAALPAQVEPEGEAVDWWDELTGGQPDEPVQRIDCPFEVRDAETEEDLARVAAGLCAAILPVGSAGLARYLFRPESQRPLSAREGPWLVLVGSDHPVSRAQLRAVEAAQLSGVVVNAEEFPGALAGVFATGGETAARFLRSTGALGLGSLRELLPGVPAGQVLGGRYNDVLMVLKAGGFGGPDTIVRAIQAFR